MNLPDHIIELVEKLKEPLNLDRWVIKLEHGPLDDTAACSAMPEYKTATLGFNLEKLATGDELDEIVVHEMMHCHTWPTFDLAEALGNAMSEMAPKTMRAPLRAIWTEQVRLAGEDVNTQVSFVVLKLLRRLWAAERELKEVKRKLKQVDKVALTS